MIIASPRLNYAYWSATRATLSLLARGSQTRPSTSHGFSALRRVSFAEGPLKAVHGTADGHPPHEGQQFAARVQALSNDWGSSLTPSHVPAMEAELGPENAPSVERLKRR